MRSKLVSGVLTAALAMSLVPAPALADALESTGRQLEEQAAAAEPAVPTEESPTVEGVEKDAESAAERGVRAATEEPSQEVGAEALTTDLGLNVTPMDDAVPSALTSVVSADLQVIARAAAPAKDAATLAGIQGTVSYQYGAVSGSTSIVDPNNIERIGNPMPNNETGGWRMIVTLKSDLTAADFGLTTEQLGGENPADLFVDSSSDLSIQFITDGPDDTMWGVSSGAGASLSFVSGKPMPEEPGTISIATIIETAGTVGYTLNRLDGTTYEGTASIGSDANIANFGASYWDGDSWAVDIPLQVFDTPEEYGLAVPEGFASDYALNPEVSDTTVKFLNVDGSWEAAAGAGATLVFEEVAPEPTVAFDVRDVLDVDNAVHYYASGSSKHATAITSADNVVSVGEPVYHFGGTKPYWTVEVTLRTEGVTAADYDVPTGYLGGTDPAEWVVDDAAENDVTTSFTLREGQSSWRATTGGYALLHFVHEQAPEFVLADVVDARNTVSYSLRRAAGGAYESRASIGSVENVEKVGEPYRNADGDWAVDVTLKSDIEPSDLDIEDWQTQGKPYALDVEASKLTVTFVWTTNVLGNSAWQSNGISNNGSLVFAERTAPDFDVADELNTYGTVTYDLVYMDGTSSKDNGTTIRQSANVERVGEAYLDTDGNWAVDVTLSGDATPDDYNVPNWQMHDDEYELDVQASKLTMTFRTNGVEGTTWYCSGADRASLVFVGKAAEPSVAFDADAALAAYHTVHYTATTQTIENSTSIGKAGNIESIGAPVYDEAADRWTVEVTLKSEGVTAADYGVLPGFLDGSDPAGWVIDPAAQNDLTVTFALEAGSDAWAMADGGYALLHFVEKAAPAAPAFDIFDELDVVGTVSYEVHNTDGSIYNDDGFGAILSADNVEKIGEARQEADGTWAVDVTLKSDLTPSNLGVDDWKLGDGEYELDPSSKLTLTFRTLTVDGTEWYVLGDENRADVIFVEQAKEQDPDDNPGGEVVDPSGPNDDQKGDDQSVENVTDDGSVQPAGEMDNVNKYSRGPKDEVPETGDATSVAFAGVAVVGVAALAAGIALERKRSID